MLQKIFKVIVQYKKYLVWCFWISDGVLLTLVFSGAIASYQAPNQYEFFEALGKKAGTLTVLIFLVVLIPGMARRFKIRHVLVTIIMLFRRQLGIMAFLLALTHALLVRLIPIVVYRQPLQFALFELSGITAVLLLLPLFLTSNDYSVRKLGKIWQKIHALMYIIVWFIGFHLLLQREKLGIIVLVFALLEIVSHVYARKSARSA